MQYDNKSQRTPIIGPLLLVLKSRRVLVAMVSLIVGFVVSVVPSLEPVQTELVVLVVTLALALIGGYSMEDAARAARSQPPLKPDDVQAAIEQAVTAAIVELRERTDQAE
ncbi:MAG: hypothetical protein AAF787_03225 [Chloroflexota bacterium]